MYQSVTDVIAYLDEGQVVCPTCMDKVTSNTDDLDVLFRDSEVDAPVHCVTCGELIPTSLTPDGEGYVRERAAEHRSTVVEQWLDEWPHLRPDEEDE